MHDAPRPLRTRRSLRSTIAPACRRRPAPACAASPTRPR
ncbi:hypothetical protein L494_3522 [Bordetella bronchiseptica CA90 BB1334]|nr:hypothetical protein L576_3614 [Bordetella bronchiseptica OSU054]KDB77919.1 hypothetical protein L494_3522 [Bordetella bronchiseptica CA90 BB1334]KDD45101.1 hypothetical protein L532_3550 [Bordetella bronchiseptica OSU095]